MSQKIKGGSGIMRQTESKITSKIPPKILICTCICETVFPIIDSLCSSPTQKDDFGHPQYATSLYSKLRAHSILGGPSVNNNENFMRAILSI